MTVTTPDGPVPWDDEAGERLIGSKVLIGTTYRSPGGDRQEQVFGIVTAAGPGGIEVRLEGQRAGDLFGLPPDLRAVSRAAPGVYRLRSTGEEVSDPDYICTWTIHPRERRDDTVIPPGSVSTA